MIKAWLNNLNGWQRIFLLLSVAWAVFVCFSNVIVGEEFKEFKRIKPPSMRLASKAGNEYPYYVRKRTYEKYLSRYGEEFNAYLEAERFSESESEDSLIAKFHISFPQSYLPEYSSMESFLADKGITIDKGLSLKLIDTDGNPVDWTLHMWSGEYLLLRGHFPEHSEGFDAIDAAISEEFQFEALYFQELKENYLLLPLKILAAVFLPIIAIYLLVLGAVRTVAWVIAGFAG